MSKKIKLLYGIFSIIPVITILSSCQAKQDINRWDYLEIKLLNKQRNEIKLTELSNDSFSIKSNNEQLKYTLIDFKINVLNNKVDLNIQVLDTKTNQKENKVFSLDGFKKEEKQAESLNSTTNSEILDKVSINMLSKDIKSFKTDSIESIKETNLSFINVDKDIYDVNVKEFKFDKEKNLLTFNLNIQNKLTKKVITKTYSYKDILEIKQINELDEILNKINVSIKNINIDKYKETKASSIKQESIQFENIDLNIYKVKINNFKTNDITGQITFDLSIETNAEPKKYSEIKKSIKLEGFASSGLASLAESKQLFKVDKSVATYKEEIAKIKELLGTEGNNRSYFRIDYRKAKELKDIKFMFGASSKKATNILKMLSINSSVSIEEIKSIVPPLKYNDGKNVEKNRVALFFKLDINKKIIVEYRLSRDNDAKVYIMELE
ncbi:hypothetical protein [Mycoplasmopsis alligatoris]|uniref:Lipoprotein n=1 Tax=Mycoplasmopsis alligatoris A21JP2 TaxID=747682 RepID=D4XW95_9BACT|nr:hypothetical protein [Mycoplasmopsis alligatoris]EFF41388.1 hypothetical protein MALL_0758 [Mycoplasmopsis alligatoris A21JP2]